MDEFFNGYSVSTMTVLDFFLYGYLWVEFFLEDLVSYNYFSLSFCNSTLILVKFNLQIFGLSHIRLIHLTLHRDKHLF